MEVIMKKRILNWLFGTDDVKEYIHLLHEVLHCIETHLDEIRSHLKTLEEERKNLDIIRKLIRICENHDIDVDEEIKHIEL